MRLHSLHILKQSAQHPKPTIFEVIEVLNGGADILLKKRGFNKPVHYSGSEFEKQFQPIKASAND